MKLGLSEDEIVLAIIAALLLTIGSVMAEAVQRAQGQRQIVEAGPFS